MTSPVTVAVKSGDLRLACDISTALRARPRVCLLQPEQEARAEALLVLATELDEEALAFMRGACRGHGRPRIVLVAQYVGRAQLLRAVRHGLVNVLPRRTGLDHIVVALMRTHEGQMRLSDSALVDGLDLRHRAQAVGGVTPSWAP
ncbi:hypothetical protein ABZ153_20755 [Streptomyces sp. NPDC006290]|uniref:hypothetical protein n=1 Tax=Streptomyces sp. NPDC006290 TaxID=3156745 RepID=UPI00339F8B3A